MSESEYLVCVWARVQDNDRPQFIAAYPSSLVVWLPEEYEARRAEAEAWFCDFLDPREGVEFFDTRESVERPELEAQGA